MRLGSVLVLFSFFNVQLLALVTGWLFLVQQVQPIVENPAEPANSVIFFVQIMLAAGVMLLVLKYYKGRLLFKLIEYVLIFITAWTFVGVLTNDDFFGLTAAAVALLIRWKFEESRNPLMLFASAIIGALLGISLDILPAALFAVLLSAYDWFAVFKSKHMITLAEGLRDRGASFSISFPSKPLPKATKTTKTGTEKLKLVKVKAETVELGTGDLVIPAMLVVSALKISLGSAIATLVGATAGITLLFYFIDKRKGYWPALPPIVGGALLLFAISQAVLLLF